MPLPKSDYSLISYVRDYATTKKSRRLAERDPTRNFRNDTPAGLDECDCAGNDDNSMTTSTITWCSYESFCLIQDALLGAR
jgi:hypothetical protein